jgi:hypothetical protein
MASTMLSALKGYQHMGLQLRTRTGGTRRERAIDAFFPNI